MRVQTANIGKEALCIMCGCCVSECNSMESDPDFLGPAALAKAQRFVGDQRGPKGVDPRDAIAKLGAEAFRFGSGSEFGAKTNMFAPIGTLVEPGVAHAQVFVDSTHKGGFLDETQRGPKTLGPLAAVLDVPFALRLARAGKVPNPLHKHKAKNNDEVKRLWKLLQQQERAQEGLPTNHPSLIDSHD